LFLLLVQLAVKRSNSDRLLAYFDRYKAPLILFLLASETALLAFVTHKKFSAFERSESVVQTEPGKNYSLLIDAERFPIKTHSGDEISIRIVHGQESNFRLSPKRVVILEKDRQVSMAVVHASRFKFYYNRPDELKPLYERENLGRLRGKTDWQTIQNVLERITDELKPGIPSVYPPKNAIKILDLYRHRKIEVFCAQYCYVTVQFLQSLGYFARYITINGHEICETWVPQYQKWVCLDPTNGVYFVDAAGTKLSALEIAKAPRAAHAISRHPKDADSRLSESYEHLWFWLRNDLVKNPLNIYDLNKYRVQAIWRDDQLEDLEPGDLYTLYPGELYQNPS
jgi:hypothetical protein